MRSDDHQRVLLATTIALSSVSSDSPRVTKKTVTVMTSHFSLYEESRIKGVDMILHRHDLFPSPSSSSSDDDTNNDCGEVILGDFNAEPNEITITKFLSANYTDTWLDCHPNNNNNNNKDDNHDDQHNDHRRELLSTSDTSDMSSNLADGDGFTFPACKPIKRIDFIFYRPQDRSRNNKNGNKQCKLKAERSYIIGQSPTADTGKCLSYLSTYTIYGMYYLFTCIIYRTFIEFS
jgi:hypothetical protein